MFKTRRPEPHTQLRSPQPKRMVKLPDEIVSEILRHSPRRTAVQALRVSKLWARAAEPWLYKRVTIGRGWKTLLGQLARSPQRARLIKILVVFEDASLDDLSEWIPQMTRLGQIMYSCRAPVTELSHRRPTSRLQASVEFDEADEGLDAFLHLLGNIRRPIHIDISSTLSELARLPDNSLAFTDSIGLCIREESLSEVGGEYVPDAARQLIHVRRLNVHVEWVGNDSTDLLMSLGAAPIEHLSLSSCSTPLDLPAWKVTLPQTIEYIVPPMLEDYRVCSDSPTRSAPSRLFSRYGSCGATSLIISSQHRRPTFFIRQLIQSATKNEAFSSIRFQSLASSALS